MALDVVSDLLAPSGQDTANITVIELDLDILDGTVDFKTSAQKVIAIRITDIQGEAINVAFLAMAVAAPCGIFV